MTLRMYDTLSRGKREFEPRDEGRVSMYVCGPTVYNHIHVGNARTFLSFDVIRRYLSYVYGPENVVFVRNVTDVDDKIIERAAEEGRSAEEVAAEYTEAFREAMAGLGVEPPDFEPKATETVGPMIEMVERLIEKGHAYEVGGDVYFAVRSFPRYGTLSGRDIDDLRSGSRVEVDHRKRDPVDFALWKAAKPGEPHWSSPWGEGRPGWHLECSVMATGELGESFDIHGGGSDLVFPHHENEVAQSEADTGKPFARYWLHGGMLRIDQEKMSKSLGNFTLLRDVMERHPAPVIRLLMLQTHYRSPLDFSEERLGEATSALERLGGAVRDARSWASSAAAAAPAEALDGLGAAIAAARERFVSEMDDDFNTAGALGALFELTRALNSFRAQWGIGPDGQQRALMIEASDTLESMLGVLGIVLRGERELPPDVIALAAELVGFEGEDAVQAGEALKAARARARAAKDWAVADAIRVRLDGLGIEVKDNPDGSTDLVARS